MVACFLVVLQIGKSIRYRFAFRLGSVSDCILVYQESQPYALIRALTMFLLVRPLDLLTVGISGWFTHIYHGITSHCNIKCISFIVLLIYLARSRHSVVINIFAEPTVFQNCHASVHFVRKITWNLQQVFFLNMKYVHRFDPLLNIHNFFFLMKKIRRIQLKLLIRKKGQHFMFTSASSV